MARRIQVTITGDSGDLLKSLAIAGASLRAFSRDANSSLRDMNVQSGSVGVSLRRLGDDMDNTGKKVSNLRRNHDDLNRTWRRVNEEVFAILIPALAGSIPMLLNGVSALSAGAVSLASAVAPSIASLVSLAAATAPAALGITSIAQSIAGAGFVLGVFALATHGIGTVMKDAFDTGDKAAKKLQKDLEQLSPVVRPLGDQIAKLHPLFLKLQDAAAKPIIPALVKAIQAAIPLFPILSGAVAATANVLAGLIRNATSVIQAPLFRGVFTQVLRNIVGALSALGPPALDVARNLLFVVQAAQPLFNWFVQLGVAALNYTSRLLIVARNTGALTLIFRLAQVAIASLIRIALNVGAVLARVFLAALPAGTMLLQKIVQLSDHFKAWGTSQRTFDMLVRFFNNAAQSAMQLGRIVFNLGVVLVNVFSGGQRTGQSLLQMIVNLTDRWRGWSRSVEGRNSIRQWFEGSKGTIIEFGRLVGAIFTSFAKLSGQVSFAPILVQIRTQLLPALVQFITTFAQIGPHLIGIISGFVRLIAVLSQDFQWLKLFYSTLNLLLNAMASLAQRSSVFRTMLSLLIQIAIAAKTISFLKQVAEMTKLASVARVLIGANLGAAASANVLAGAETRAAAASGRSGAAAGLAGARIGSMGNIASVVSRSGLLTLVTRLGGAAVAAALVGSAMDQLTRRFRQWQPVILAAAGGVGHFGDIMRSIRLKDFGGAVTSLLNPTRAIPSVFRIASGSVNAFASTGNRTAQSMQKVGSVAGTVGSSIKNLGGPLGIAVGGFRVARSVFDAFKGSGDRATVSTRNLAGALGRGFSQSAVNAASSARLTGQAAAFAKQKFDQSKSSVKQWADAGLNAAKTFQGTLTKASSVTANTVIGDLKRQVTNMRQFSADIGTLLKKGFSPDAIKSLSEKGPQYVHALATGSGKQMAMAKQLMAVQNGLIHGNWQQTVDALVRKQVQGATGIVLNNRTNMEKYRADHASKMAQLRGNFDRENNAMKAFQAARLAEMRGVNAREFSSMEGTSKAKLASVRSATAREFTSMQGTAKTRMGQIRGVSAAELHTTGMKFNELNRSANAALHGIRDESVNIAMSGSGGVTWSATATAFKFRAGRMARGGKITAGTTGTADDVLAWLSRGEVVVPATKAQSPDFVYWARMNKIPGFSPAPISANAAIKGAPASDLPAFAQGGIVTKTPGSDRVERMIQSTASRMQAASKAAAELVGKNAANAVVAAAIEWQNTFGGNFQGALQFAKSQAGKPYIWGAAGPKGYDCSGFMSAILNVIQGNSPYHRLFSTGTIGAGVAGLQRGAHGPFVIGSTRNAGGGIGHMAGTLLGVNVESRGSNPHGVVVGGNARGSNNPLFREHYFFKGSGMGAGGSEGGPGGGAPASNMRLGQAMAAHRGWTGAQWNALRTLWMRESGWSNTARNPSSGAFGIPQALPPSKMGRAGAAGNPTAQIAWGLSYIAGRYGSPIGALNWWNRHHWYGSGGIFTQPSIIGVGDNGPEAVVPLRTLTRPQPPTANMGVRKLTQGEPRSGTIVLEINGRRFAAAIIDDLDDIAGSRIRLN